MDIITITDLALQPTPLGGQSRILFDKPEVRVVNLVLADGERVAAHEAPVDVVFLVLNGSASLTAGPQRSVIGAGQMVFCPAGISRSLDADQGCSLNLLVIRSPNQ